MFNYQIINLNIEKCPITIKHLHGYSLRYARGEVRSWWTASGFDKLNPALSTTPAYRLADYTFPGQFSYLDDPSTSSVTKGFGLMFYNARWMDPVLGRFIQADTIVPGGIQGLDRYAYVNNNPLRYVDPTGHFTNDAIKDYLKGRYGNRWESYWKSWSADVWWMNILHSAEAGDYVTRIVSSEDGFMAEHYQFSGEGEDVLGGIMMTSELGGTPADSDAADLNNLYEDQGAGLVVTGGYQNGDVRVKAKTPNILSADVFTESRTTSKILNVSINLEAAVIGWALCNLPCALLYAGATGYFAEEIAALPLPFPVLTGDQTLNVYFNDGKGPRTCRGYPVQFVAAGYRARFRNGQQLLGTDGFNSYGSMCQ